MTDLVAYTSSGDDPTGGRLVAWAATLGAAKQIADALCITTFAPAHFRGKPQDGAAAIMFGDEIGLSPTQALHSIYVIKGTPSLYARQMVAIVMAHGHDVWTDEKTDSKVTVSGCRRGSAHVHSETWTTARARQAGYLSNALYASDPQAMLYARAAADICRQIAPDALAGLAYTVEELEITDEPTTKIRRAAPSTRSITAQRAPAPEPTPEPPLEPEPLVPPPDEELADVVLDDEPLTPAQLVKLHATMNDAGISERAEALDYLSDVLHRSITSSKDLTKREASEVIDRLTDLLETPFTGTPEGETS